MIQKKPSMLYLGLFYGNGVICLIDNGVKWRI